jgi:hypothetical protein
MSLSCIIKGSDICCVGFSSEFTAKAGEQVVTLEDKEIPKDFKARHYTVVESGGKYSLKKKTASAIATADQAFEDTYKPAKLTELKAIDPSTLTGELKTVVEFLQGIYG